MLNLECVKSAQALADSVGLHLTARLTDHFVPTAQDHFIIGLALSAETFSLSDAAKLISAFERRSPVYSTTRASDFIKRTMAKVRLSLEKTVQTPAAEELDELALLGLSIRAYNCLKRYQINDLATLYTFTRDELLEIQNFGKKCFDELSKGLASLALPEITNTVPEPDDITSYAAFVDLQTLRSLRISEARQLNSLAHNRSFQGVVLQSLQSGEYARNKAK